MVGLCGLEPQTLRLSGVRSNHLSYRPGASSWPQSVGKSAASPRSRRRKRRWVQACLRRVPMTYKAAPSLAPPGLVIPRKEVIQPQVPLRLPCYDLVPITELTVGASFLAVRYATLGTSGFRGLTGGVYKAQEHIHRGVADPRLLAIPTSWRRIAASNPNWDRVYAICSPSRVSFVLSRPLWHVCSPGHKGHDDLTSSPPSSVLTTAVSLESPA